MGKSIWTPERALSSSPEFPCPKEILDAQVLLEIKHLSFDNTVKLGHIVVNKIVAKDVSCFFEEALRLKFPIDNITPAAAYNFDDEALMAGNVSSGFNYRLIAGTDKVSKHGLGLAFDINPRQNPYIRYPKDGEPIVEPHGVVWDPHLPGTLSENHPLVVLMKQKGWEWGGDWLPESGRTDYQHFQK